VSWRYLKGGCKPAYPDYVKPRLYVDDFLATPLKSGNFAPPAVEFPDWGTMVGDLWQMDMNSQLGTCGIAGMDNYQIALAVYSGQTPTPWGPVIAQQLYEELGGYVPGEPSTDNGTNLQDNLQFWRNNPINAKEILAFGALRPGSWFRPERVYAMAAFGPLYNGYNFPESAETQFQNGDPFVVVPGSQTAGGHCMIEAAELNTVDSPRPVTWAKMWSMTRGWLMTCTTESWVIIDEEAIERNGSNQYGWDMTGMNEALAGLTGESNPLKLKTIR
jgi:hypothetical protein